MQANNYLEFILVLPFLVQLVGIVVIGYLSLKNGQQAINDISEQLLFEITSRVIDVQNIFPEIIKKNS